MTKLCNAMMRLAAVALLLGTAGLGCGSSGGSQCGDAGCIDGGGGHLYGLSEGTFCYKIDGVSGVTDGCMIGVGNLVGQSFPATYTTSGTTGTFSIGNSGSLGMGTISDNVGTLNRSGVTSDAQMPTCTWTQMDTTMVTLTADNTFTASVVEMQSSFASACAAASVPTGGSCTSSWTWNMKIDSTKSPSNGCQ